jgi:hypothetical protein
MKRLSVFAIALSFVCAACGGTAVSPSAVRPTFTAVLSPANEVPAITDAESSGSGNVTVTFDTTFSGGNITAATATFVAQLSGFPPNTPINIAHIHPGAVGVNGGVLVSTGLTAGELVLQNGSGTFTKGPVTVLPEVAQQIMNNPAGFYFNVHSTAHPGGVARGQLQRVQ